MLIAVSPDAFDIISVSPTQVLTTDQRRNLGNIAKMLQFAASKKGFAEESPHLMCLNPFIVECHDRFKRFFRNCIQVRHINATSRLHPQLFVDICDCD